MKKYDLIYFLGDSYTEGHHTDNVLPEPIPIYQRFTDIVAKEIKCPYIVDARGGASNQWIHRQLYENIATIQDKNALVIHSWSEPTRIELYSNKYDRLETVNDSYFDKEFVKLFYNHAFSDNHRLYDRLTEPFVISARALLSFLNIDYVETYSNGPVLDIDVLDMEKTLKPSYREICGEDGSIYNPETNFYGHQNVLGNKRIADFILNKIGSLYK